MNLIDRLFRDLRSRGDKAFMPFLTAGDPDLPATEKFVAHLVECGAHLVELGFPYTDPIADGPVIQASYTRALAHGLHVDDVFASVRRLADAPALRSRGVPLVGMVSYSLVHRRRPDAFLRQAEAAGLSGLIVPDLPVEESAELVALGRARDFKIIHLVTPTTPPARAVDITRASSGFLYCVSVTGITGERDRLPEQLHEQLAWLRQHTDLPLCVGFGVSRPEHVRLLRDVADGIIVGSALVKFLEEAKARPAAAVAQPMGDLVRTLIAALNPGTPPR